VTQALHSDEIPIDAELVRLLVSRVLPAYADAPVRRLSSSGSSTFLDALRQVEIPTVAVNNPDLRSYRGEPLARMDQATRENIERCRCLGTSISTSTPPSRCGSMP
jgi:hypothetical protein